MKGRSVLAAVFANVSIWSALPVRADEAAAIAALREAGFKVKQAAGATEIGFGQPEWTPDLWQRLGEIASLTVLRGTARCADNAGLEVLAKLPRLETLYLNASTFDDQGFALETESPRAATGMTANRPAAAARARSVDCVFLIIVGTPNPSEV